VARISSAFWATGRELFAKRIFEEAAGVAFFSTVSIFPLMLVLLQLSFQVGALARNWDKAMNLVKSLIPMEVIQTLFIYYQNSHDASSIGLFSAAFISALWLSTLAFQIALKTIRRVVKENPQPGPYSRSVGVLLIFFIYFSAILAVQLLAIGGWVLASLEGFDLIGRWTTGVLWAFRWLLIVGFTFVAALLLLGMASNDLTKLRQHRAGALLFSLSWIAVTNAMVGYYKMVDTQRILFGAISSVFMLMMWVYAMCVLLLFCALFNRHYYGLQLDDLRQSEPGDRVPN